MLEPKRLIVYYVPMGEERNYITTDSADYSVKAPKVPRQTLRVFAKDLSRYFVGLSAEKVDIVREYLSLQAYLGLFDDTLMTRSFFDKLPNELKDVIKDSLTPETSFGTLDLPTTYKVKLVELMIADEITDVLSSPKVEIWVNPKLKEALLELGLDLDLGLQLVDYAAQPIVAKKALLDIMEVQEMQAHTIVLARKTYPDGVVPNSIMALFTSGIKKTTFNKLTDLDEQYEVAFNALNDPFSGLLNHIVDHHEATGGDEQSEDVMKEGKTWVDELYSTEYVIDPKKEAEGKWWEDDWDISDQRSRILPEIKNQIVAYLRSLYAGRTIYQILKAEDDITKDEIFAAFYRNDNNKTIYYGDDEDSREVSIFLTSDGKIGGNDRGGLYVEPHNITPSEGLVDDLEVAMVDQTVKWIKTEMEAMTETKARWYKDGLLEDQVIESTLYQRLIETDATSESDLLPPCLQEALNIESNYYRKLPLFYSPRNDIFLMPFLSANKQSEQINPLKDMFISSRLRLERYQGFAGSAREMLDILGLTAIASEKDVKKAYRKIARDSSPIFNCPKEEIEPEEWQRMNDHFLQATKAYGALSGRKLGSHSVTPLGKLSCYF